MKNKDSLFMIKKSLFYLEIKDYSKAFFWINKAKSLRKRIQGVDHIRAICLLKMNRVPEACEVLKEEVRLFPENIEAIELLDNLEKVVTPTNTKSFFDDDFERVLEIIRPYTMVGDSRLFSLYRLSKKICERNLPGNFVECGVAAGGTSALLAYVINRHSSIQRFLYAFDTYEGLPDPTEKDRHNNISANDIGWVGGTCAASEDFVNEVSQKLGVLHIIRTVKGLFKDTLPEWNVNIQKVAFLHMDGDWYESTKDILTNLYDIVVPEGIIQVDDYGHWSGCKEALDEFLSSSKIDLKINKIDGAGIWFQKPSQKKNELKINFDTASNYEKIDIHECPLCRNADIFHIKSFLSNDIVIKYNKNLNTNVSNIINSQYVHLYGCLDTGFRFFYPFNIEGDSNFYSQLSKFPWYYMEWKWEHDIAIRHIPFNANVLEVGCAQGDFLRAVNQQLNGKVVGIELNLEAAHSAKEKGIQVYSELLSNHSFKQNEIYDAVCAFQVVEHIAQIGAFIDDVLRVLKPGGKFIMSVPNQDSFIGLDDFGILDMPPHHMNRWNEKALRSLETFLPVRLLFLEFEPLQKYHFNYFASVVRKKLKNDYQLHESLIKLSQENPEQIRGHTVLAVYEKLSDV